MSTTLVDVEADVVTTPPRGAPIVGGLAIIAAAVQELARVGRSHSSLHAEPLAPPARVDVWTHDGYVGAFLTDGHLFVSVVQEVQP